MRKFFLLSVLLPLVCISCAQMTWLRKSWGRISCVERIISRKTEPPATFNREEFSQRCSLATALAFDDLAAWWTSDSITGEKKPRLDSLDSTWFVENLETRHVYYGRYLPENNIYTLKYAFEVLEDSTVTRIAKIVYPRTLEMARAVYTGSKRFTAILDSFMLDFKFNHYIRHNEDSTFSMWFFPAGMGNYCAYGLSIFLLINPSGTEVRDFKITGNELRYFEVQKRPSTIELDNTFDDVPSVGNIFFVIVYGKYFKKITIKNRNSTTSATISSDSTLQWSHAVR